MSTSISVSLRVRLLRVHACPKCGSQGLAAAPAPLPGSIDDIIPKAPGLCKTVSLTFTKSNGEDDQRAESMLGKSPGSILAPQDHQDRTNVWKTKTRSQRYGSSVRFMPGMLQTWIQTQSPEPPENMNKNKQEHFSFQSRLTGQN